MSRIESVLARTVRVPLDTPVSFSTRHVTARDYTLVKVACDDGVQGIGFCYAGSVGGEIVTVAVQELLSRVLIGRDPYLVEGLWSDMYQEALLHGRAGSVIRAISALDIALWDRNSRAAGLPLYKYLGAYRESTVPAYASGGYYADGKKPEMLGEELVRYVDMGFEAVKIKIGRLDPDGEEARVAVARKAIGPKISLMLDANNAWSTPHEALRVVERLENYDPYWIEEPFSPDNIDAHAQLAERISIPVATGEIEAGIWRHKELLDKRAAAILQTDAAVCGGVSEFRRIAAMAGAYGATMSPHWFHDLHVHLVGATPNAEYVEFFPDSSVLNFRRLVDRELEIRDGTLVLPQLPGLGFDFDEDMVSSLSPDVWN